MISRVLVYILLLLCVYTVIYTIMKKDFWDKNRTLYSNLFTLKSFIMGVIFGLILILLIAKDNGLI
ncbi:prepilin signal peptidase PulO-like enzyme (type II secretory pathway) [Myroides gitamensis]|nr:prepilin signal peptidase PulO-like enzyme (type II secretory pathway) [Myroides odoratus]MDH6600198.1 prepilin signal peptidase PulO-like enzyme (type II secretory pathway) [Myroides gitamensis]